MVEGSVGVLGRADCDNREVEVSDGFGGDRGRDWILLPLIVGFTDKESSAKESETNNYKPENLCWFCLTGKNQIDNTL